MNIKRVRVIFALTVTLVAAIISMYARAMDWGIVPTLLAVGVSTAIIWVASLEFKMKNILLQFLMYLSAIFLLDTYAKVRGFESFTELGFWSFLAVLFIVFLIIRALVKLNRGWM